MSQFEAPSRLAFPRYSDLPPPAPEPGDGPRREGLAILQVELGVGQQGRREQIAPHQARKPIFVFAFRKGWFPAGPIPSPRPPSFTPCPMSRDLWVGLRAGPGHANPTGLTSPPWHLGALPWTRRWATQLSRFARKTRPLVAVNNRRIARKGPEFQVTEPSPSLRTSGARACTQTQNPCTLRAHTSTHKGVCGGDPAATSPSRHFFSCPLMLRPRSPAASTLQLAPGAGVYL